MIETVCMDAFYFHQLNIGLVVLGVAIGALALLFAQAMIRQNDEEVMLKRRLIAENAELRERVKGGRK